MNDKTSHTMLEPTTARLDANWGWVEMLQLR